MGVVIDEDLYNVSTAHGYKFDDTEMLWCAGVIGSLSPSQREFKKQQGKVRWETPVPSGLQERIKKFQEGADEAERKYNEEGRPGILRWLDLMREEVERKRGLAIEEKRHLKD